MKKTHMSIHSFYCLQCGKKDYDLPRKQGCKKEKFHRKKLYCPFCKIEVNHVECKNEEEIYQFKRDFQEGIFVEEAEKSSVFIQSEFKFI